MTLGSSVGFVEETQNDLACDFCEQLIVHLKDILVANTTESEFQQVLLGLCKQTGNFADEVSIQQKCYNNGWWLRASFLLNNSDLKTAVTLITD